MKLKENIHQAINRMNKNDLMLLYEQIHLLEQVKQNSEKPKENTPVEKILAMTSSSTSCWSDIIQEERRERI